MRTAVGAISRFLADLDIWTSNGTDHSTDSLSGVLVFYAVITGTPNLDRVAYIRSLTDVLNLRRSHGKASVVQDVFYK